MTSRYLLKPTRSLGRACAETIGCDPDGTDCPHPDCRLAEICPRWSGAGLAAERGASGSFQHSS